MHCIIIVYTHLLLCNHNFLFSWLLPVYMYVIKHWVWIVRIVCRLIRVVILSAVLWSFLDIKSANWLKNGVGTYYKLSSITYYLVLCYLFCAYTQKYLRSHRILCSTESDPHSHCLHLHLISRLSHNLAFDCLQDAEWRGLVIKSG